MLRSEVSFRHGIRANRTYLAEMVCKWLELERAGLEMSSASRWGLKPFAGGCSCSQGLRKMGWMEGGKGILANRPRRGTKEVRSAGRS